MNLEVCVASASEHLSPPLDWPLLPRALTHSQSSEVVTQEKVLGSSALKAAEIGVTMGFEMSETGFTDLLSANSTRHMSVSFPIQDLKIGTMLRVCAPPGNQNLSTPLD